MEDYDSYIAIHNRLQAIIDRNNGNNDILTFKVPRFWVGDTNYNLKKCNAFLIKKLRDAGYNVKYKTPNILVMYGMKKFKKVHKNDENEKSPVKVKPGRKKKKNDENVKITITDPTIIDIVNSVMKYSTA